MVWPGSPACLPLAGVERAGIGAGMADDMARDSAACLAWPTRRKESCELT